MWEVYYVDEPNTGDAKCSEVKYYSDLREALESWGLLEYDDGNLDSIITYSFLHGNRYYVIQRKGGGEIVGND